MPPKRKGSQGQPKLRIQKPRNRSKQSKQIQTRLQIKNNPNSRQWKPKSSPSSTQKQHNDPQQKSLQRLNQLISRNDLQLIKQEKNNIVQQILRIWGERQKYKQEQLNIEKKMVKICEQGHFGEHQIAHDVFYGSYLLFYEGRIQSEEILKNAKQDDTTQQGHQQQLTDIILHNSRNINKYCNDKTIIEGMSNQQDKQSFQNQQRKNEEQTKLNFKDKQI